MKQIVKTADGELTYASMAHVKVLYEQGFITPDDQIRAETSNRWQRCGDLRVLAEAENRGRRETKMGLRVAMALAASVILAGIVERERWLLFAGLVFLGVLVPFFVYQRNSRAG